MFAPSRLIAAAGLSALWQGDHAGSARRLASWSTWRTSTPPAPTMCWRWRTKPLILSHTNPRAFYDIERNSTDAHIKGVVAQCGRRGRHQCRAGKQPSRARRRWIAIIDHIEHVITGIAGDRSTSGLGLDFFEFILQRDGRPEERRRLDAMATVCFVPESAATIRTCAT